MFSSLAQQLIDALAANIAVLDRHGEIVAVNRAWRQFADSNGGRSDGVGINYLDLCAPAVERHLLSSIPAVSFAPDDHSLMAARGIASVLFDDMPRFQLTYPCHSPTEQRWFLLTVTPLELDGTRYAIVAHENITTLKQREQDTVAALTGTVEAMAHMVERRDPYTAGHQKNVARLAVAIAQALGLKGEALHGIHLAASIHDLGKIAVPSEILTRPGALSDLEMGLMRTHCQVGWELVATIPFPWPLADVILQHHEHLDGSGYPFGLRGEAIRVESRIVAIADVADAISSHRPYRPSRGIEIANREIRQCAGSFYDPDVVEAYFRPEVQQLLAELYR